MGLPAARVQGMGDRSAGSIVIEEDRVLQESPRRQRILAFPYSHTLSHVSRPLLLAIELRKRNFEVVFAGEKQWSFVKENGFEVIPVYEPDPKLLYDNIRKGKLRFISDDEVEKIIRADLALYEKVCPDLVLSDGRFTAPISTHIAGLKHAAIVNVSSTEYRALPYIPLFDWIPDGIIGRGTPVWKKIELFNLCLEMAVFDNVMKIFIRQSRKLGMKKRITATNCLTGKDLTLLADIPEYFPTRNLPPDYQYIGPLTLKTSMESPSWWPPKQRGGRLIYLTMGTTGIGDFFRNIYELIEKTDLTFVVTTGGQIEGLKTVEGVIYLEKFMNGDLIMRKSDLVVCHGGNGTIYQALQHGKPIIGIPTIPDQKFNMRRVESLGVGLAVKWEEFASDPAILLEVISRVIKTKTFSQNAKRMKSVLARYDGGRQGADILEGLLAT
jgi:UDP:flavonoid glycosyltransferase YjiC (YdhE family)